MSKPQVHSVSSAKKYGGAAEDYLDIHTFMDTSKGAIGDNRHRVLTHHAGFLVSILPNVFGETFKRISDRRVLSTRDIGEQHCAEDYHGYIPTVQDFLDCLQLKPWMSAQGFLLSDATANPIYHNISTPHGFIERMQVQTGRVFDAYSVRITSKILAVLDYGRAYCNDFRYRALSYNSWFIETVIPAIFKVDSVIGVDPRAIAAAYVEMQMGHIPTAQDWFGDMPLTGWMNNGRGTPPPSVAGLRSHMRTTVIKFNEIDTD